MAERIRAAGRLAATAVLAAGLAGCEDLPDTLTVTGGDATAGQHLIAVHGCSACHRIPGIRSVSSNVGPSLAGFGRRAYIAGRIPNRPANLTSWLQAPEAIDPNTAMPAQGLSEPEARHVAAYLYTLR